MKIIGDLPVIHDRTHRVTCPHCGADDPDDIFVPAEGPGECLVCDALFKVQVEVLFTTTLIEP